jgi:hypothetical protein
LLAGGLHKTASLGHDPQTWLPLRFDDAGMPMPLSYVDNFTLDVAA